MPIYGVFFCVWCFDLSPTICPPALNSDAPPYYFAGLIGGQSVQAEGGLEPLPCRLTPPPDPPLLLLPASSGLPSPLPAPSAWRMWSVRSGVKGSSPGALAPGDSPRPSPSAWEGLAEGGGGATRKHLPVAWRGGDCLGWCVWLGAHFFMCMHPLNGMWIKFGMLCHSSASFLFVDAKESATLVGFSSFGGVWWGFYLDCWFTVEE